MDVISDERASPDVCFDGSDEFLPLCILYPQIPVIVANRIRHPDTAPMSTQ